MCAESDRKVRDGVEATFADIATRGDAAVRGLSVKFDGWDREDYRLSDREIQDCMDQLTGQDLKNIEFAQTIETPLTKPFFENAAFKAGVLAKIKLGRLGQVEDMIFLASDAAALMNGTSLVVDGGWTAD